MYTIAYSSRISDSYKTLRKTGKESFLVSLEESLDPKPEARNPKSPNPKP